MSKEQANVTIFPDIDLDDCQLYKIGQVAGRFGLTQRAIRFYCERGLIKERSNKGMRQFDVHNIKRLSLVLKAKFLGFSLQDIASLIVDDETHGPALVIPTERIEQEIEVLRKQQDTLLSQLLALGRFASGDTSPLAA